MGSDFDFSALTEVDEAIRLDIVESLPNAQIAQAVQQLDSDDAVYILEDLDEADQEEILAQLPFTERIRLRRALDEFIVDGVKTTLPLFRRLINEPDIQSGDYDIHWLEKYLEANKQ